MSAKPKSLGHLLRWATIPVAFIAVLAVVPIVWKSVMPPPEERIESLLPLVVAPFFLVGVWLTFSLMLGGLVLRSRHAASRIIGSIGGAVVLTLLWILVALKAYGIQFK